MRWIISFFLMIGGLPDLGHKSGLPDLGHKSGEKIFKVSSSIHYSFSLSCVIQIDITLEF